MKFYRTKYEECEVCGTEINYENSTIDKDKCDDCFEIKFDDYYLEKKEWEKKNDN